MYYISKWTNVDRIWLLWVLFQFQKVEYLFVNPVKSLLFQRIIDFVAVEEPLFFWKFWENIQGNIDSNKPHPWHFYSFGQAM